MVTRVNGTSPEVALARVLRALERELIDASDEEILEVGRELGMDPNRKESAAFRGLTYPSEWQLSDFFDSEVSRRLAALLGYGVPEERSLESATKAADARKRSRRKPRRP